MSVLDASALLAYLQHEDGASIVADAIADGATISSVNVAEVLSTLAARGENPADVVAQLTTRGLLDGAITVAVFTAADAVEVGRLRPLTRSAGLSLGDRACLALARRLEVPVLTADRSWGALTDGVSIVLIRTTPQ